MHTLTYLGIKSAKSPRGKALNGMKTLSQMSFYSMTGFVYHDHHLGTKGSKERLQNVPVVYDKDKDGILNVATGYVTSGKAKMLSLEDFVRLAK
eukprot:6536806-Ditylum_brightwellii.AAC.1